MPCELSYNGITSSSDVEKALCLPETLTSITQYTEKASSELEDTLFFIDIDQQSVIEALFNHFQRHS